MNMKTMGKQIKSPEFEASLPKLLTLLVVRLTTFGCISVAKLQASLVINRLRQRLNY